MRSLPAPAAAREPRVVGPAPELGPARGEPLSAAPHPRSIDDRTLDHAAVRVSGVERRDAARVLDGQGRRLDHHCVDARLQVLRDEAPTALAFLTRDYGFQPPQPITDGLSYERPGLKIDVTVWTWNHEMGFSTRLSVPVAEGGSWSETLDDLYVRLRLGPAQAVGSNAASGHAVCKRVHEHAAALAKVLAIDGLESEIGRTGDHA